MCAVRDAQRATAHAVMPSGCWCRLSGWTRAYGASFVSTGELSIEVIESEHVISPALKKARPVFCARLRGQNLAAQRQLVAGMTNVRPGIHSCSSSHFPSLFFISNFSASQELICRASPVNGGSGGTPTEAANSGSSRDMSGAVSMSGRRRSAG